MTSQGLLLNKRLLAVLGLGFASGLPFALTGSTLQAWFTESHISLVAIGMLSLVGLPYILKFIWAPLMDYYGFERLGKRRGWILCAQFGLVVTLLLLAEMNPVSEASKMAVVAFIIAFFSASQDIGVDAYRADILLPEERGLGASYYIFAYRIAALLSGGFALVFADYFGWKWTYDIMAVLMLLSMLPAFKAPRPVEYPSTSRNVFESIVASLNNLLRRENIFLLLIFIVLYKIGDALALSLMINFLLHGLGFSLTEVGFAYKLVSFIATIGGAFLGGLILTRWNIYRALLVFGLAQAFSNLMFVLLAIVGKHFTLMAASIFIENFCSGMSTAALMALMMSLCDQHYTAGQYALLSTVASLGRVFLGPVAALIVTAWGWTDFYIFTFVLCFPGIIALVFLKEKVLSYAPIIAD